MHDQEKVNSPENQNRGKNEWRNIPLYKHSGDTARANDELDTFRASNRANEACAKAIEKAIGDHWDGWQLTYSGVQQVMEQFGEERMNFVLANTIRLHQRQQLLLNVHAHTPITYHSI